MNFFKNTLARSSAILVIGLFIAFMGVRAFNAMPRSLFPEINYPRVTVEVNMGYRPLQTMEWSVASILERELRSVPGVRLVKSTSSRGLATIDVFLTENQDVSQAIQLVNAKLAEARALIPPSAQVTVRPITAAAFPAAEYCFVSKTKNARELRTFVEYTVRPLVMSVAGIYDSRVLGGDTPELSVELDPKKLAYRNLNVSDINDRIKNSNSIDFLGPIDKENSEVLAFGGKFVKTPEEISNIVVDSSLAQPVRIRDIGRVSLRNEWRTQSVQLNGQECVALDVLYQSGIDQNQTSLGVLKTIQDIVTKNPEISVRSWDLNDFTDAATNAVILDLGVGMVIIALVTLLFLKNLRYSLIALLSMPLAAMLTFLAMSHLGLSINLMTLGGLTAAIGLVVDNTVIVLEMYHHRKTLEANKTKFELLQETLSSVVKPMAFGTATIALVFTPISYLSGVSGMFFAPMAAVHGSSLTISVFLALLIIPGLIILLDNSKRVTSSSTHKSTFEDSLLAGLYRAVVEWGLRRSKLVTVILLVIPLLGAGLLPMAKTGFLPEWDEGDMVIDFRSVSPMGLAATERNIEPLEKYLLTIPEVDFYIRKLGTGLGELNGPPNKGEIIVKLKTNRKRSVFEIRDQVSAKASEIVKDFEFDLFQILPDRLNDLSGSAKPIVIYLRGGNSDHLDQAAAQYRDQIAKISGLDSVRIEEPEKSPELSFDLNESISRALELNPTAIDENLRFGLFSLDSSNVQIGPQTVPIRLRALNQPKVPSLADLSIYTTKGGLSKITQLGQISETKNRIESSHVDGVEVRTITAEIAGRDLGSVVKDILKVTDQTLVPGVTTELVGDYVMQQKSFTELLFAFATGLVLIFVVTLLFANRFTVAIPVTLCSTVPPVIGLVGCVIFQIPLDVSSFSGLISVTGIAVANSFMALSAIEDLPDYRDNLKRAITEGMLSRLRPILMTNLAAMAGFVPIAIGLAHGDEILRPFSIAIIVGLLGAIYTTLILFPLFYSHFSRQLVETTKDKV